MPEAPKKSRWFSRIETREDALRAIKDSSSAFLVVAALQVILMVVILRSYDVLFDAAVLAVGALLLRRYNSRAAAIVLLLLAVAEAGVTVANRLGVIAEGGKNVILALLVLWAGIRAVQATFKLHRLAMAEAAKSLVRT
jgi:hypothetical protein